MVEAFGIRCRVRVGNGVAVVLGDQVMWLLIAAYAFAVGWNVHDQATTPREPIIKQEAV